MTAGTPIDQLEQQLAESQANGDVARQIASLNALAWALSDIDLQRAYALGEAAYALASAPANGAPPDQLALAYSLRTQGYINQRLGEYPRGLAQLLQAQDIFEPRQVFDGLADVLDGIAGIYYQIGDFPEALRLILQQLAAAQRSGDQRRSANAYNNLAVVYQEMGEAGRGFETHQHNLQLAVEIDYPRMEFLACVNLAEYYLATGDYDQALQHAQRALRVSQASGFELFEVHALDFVGQSYLKRGQTEQAIASLEQALTMTRWLEAKVTEAQVLQTLAEVYRETRQIDRALDYLKQSVSVAEAVDERVVLANVHRLLSQVYEQQGDLALALAHLKQHNSIRERILGEKSDMRLRVLQVAHDTETARKETEILQLKTQQLEQEISDQRKAEQVLQAARDDLEWQVRVRTAELSDTVKQLQQEITERERAEAETQQVLQTLEQRLINRTEVLTAFFDLILLAGQAVNMTDIVEQALPRIIEVTRSDAICLHLFDVDHTSLRLIAQYNLPPENQMRLRFVRPWPEFQRWLQQPGDPLASTILPGTMLLPPELRDPTFQTHLATQIRIGRRVEGVLSYFRMTDQGYGVDEIALSAALAEQIGLVLEIEHLREKAEAIAVLEERQRLARDLHDSVTQSLYSLSLFSHAAREAAEDNDPVRLQRSLVELERNTLHTLREMRLLLYELRPADLQQEGLKQALELRLNAVERRANLQLDVQLAEVVGLSSDQEVELYHIVVEALNNVIKHAAASRVALHLTQADGSLRLRLADDGQGFDPAQVKGGMGLNNIRERVTRLGGQLTIRREPNGGTCLEVLIPDRVEES